MTQHPATHSSSHDHTNEHASIQPNRRSNRFKINYLHAHPCITIRWTRDARKTDTREPLPQLTDTGLSGRGVG
jgi:hypothetical protein